MDAKNAQPVWARVLAPVGAVSAALMLASCGGTASPASSARSSGASGASGRPTAAPVVVGHAGMLTALVQQGLASALRGRGIAVRGVKGNSLTVAANIKSGVLPADLFGSADANANQLLMGPSNGNKVRWFAVIARNAVVLAYSPKSRQLAEFQRAQRGAAAWYEPLRRPGVRLGRDNPDTDPLGYYALFVAQLAENRAGRPGLRHRILGDDRNPAQVGKAELDRLSGGEIDAMFMYATGAASAGVPFIRLPAEINLSDPAQAAGYTKVSFTNASGVTFRGGVINASIAPIEGAAHGAAALDVLDYLFSAAGRKLMREQGFLPSPVLIGGDDTAVPARLRPHVGGTYKPN
jgi:molybdate/tungstate transport system substrate-binding protein